MSSSESPASDRGVGPGPWMAQLIGAVTFYTCIPIPERWPMSFVGIARFAPWVGIAIGLIVGGVDHGLMIITLPVALRSGLDVALWLWITGGLHLDGAMDTADGWAVPDASRRLAVMADSRAGAFGVMVAIALLGLKTLCLTDLTMLRWAALPLAAGWGRWGQVLAIARYPYLKTEGKGAFHKTYAHPATDWLWGTVLLVSLAVIIGLWQPQYQLWLLGTTVGGVGIAWAVGEVVNRKLGGQTGDTYGAIVEWTEMLLLCWMVGLQGWM